MAKDTVHMENFRERQKKIISTLCSGLSFPLKSDAPKDITEEVNKLKEPKRIECN